MSVTQPLEVRVIYSSSGRRPARAVRPARQSAETSQRGWLILGIVNLVIASGFYYATWWRVDPFLYMTFLMHTPLPGVDAEQVSALILPGLTDDSRIGRPPAPSAPLVPTPRFTGNVARATIAASGYGWLTVSTASFLLLAAAAGAALAWGGVRQARIARILAGGTILAIGVWAILDWRQYGRAFPPDHTRFVMGGLVLVAGLLGLTIKRSTRFLNRMAGLGTIGAALGSAVAMTLLRSCGALEGTYSTVQFAAMVCVVFAVHSIYGWLLLLPISSRVGKSG